MRLHRDIAGLDLYALLGVSRAATAAEIQRAYRQRVRESHPDLCPSDPTRVNRMRDVNLAARVLLDPAERRAYDARSAVRGPARAGRMWWERAARAEDGEWVSPPVADRLSDPTEPWGGFPRDLRGRASRVWRFVGDGLGEIPPHGRLALGSLGFCIAVILLASSPFSDPRPVSVSPAALYP